MGNQCYTHKAQSHCVTQKKNFSIKIKIKKNISTKKENMNHEIQILNAQNSFSKSRIHFNLQKMKSIKRIKDLEEIMELGTQEEREL